MPLSITTALRNARLQLIVDAIDAGASFGEITFYSATQPAMGAAVTDQVIGGKLRMSDPCAVVAAGVLTFSTMTLLTAVSTDMTVTWARITDSDGNVVADLDVTAGGGGGAIILDSVNLLERGEISIVAATLTEGNL